MAQAAKVIGNSELQDKFEKASEMLERPNSVIFCSSLYLWLSCGDMNLNRGNQNLTSINISQHDRGNTNGEEVVSMRLHHWHTSNKDPTKALTHRWKNRYQQSEQPSNENVWTFVSYVQEMGEGAEALPTIQSDLQAHCTHSEPVSSANVEKLEEVEEEHASYPIREV